MIYQTDNSKVSVIMNCLNAEIYLREAIDSVYSQTYKDWEIILWDNVSTDNSAKIAKSYDEKLRYFRGNETVSLGQARNLAIEKARGRYIAFLDCDDIWMPQKLEKQIPLFEKSSNIGLVFSDVIKFNKKGREMRWFEGRKKIPRGKVFREILNNYFIAMPSVVLKRDVLYSQPEWFDIRFEVIEEADLFRRIAHDWEVDYVDEVLSKWRVHEESGTWTKKVLFPRENELMLEKFHSLFKEFSTDYQPEIIKMRRYIQYRYALFDWENRDNSNARKRIVSYILTSRKYLLIYLLMFFPYSLFKKIRNKLSIMPS